LAWAFSPHNPNAQGVPQTADIAKVDVQKVAAGYRASKVIVVAASSLSSGNEQIGLLNARVHSSGRAIGKGTVGHKKGHLTAFGAGSVTVGSRRS
jgi:hypothetical protein